jgi:hypothetical protein
LGKTGHGCNYNEEWIDRQNYIVRGFLGDRVVACFPDNYFSGSGFV